MKEEIGRPTEKKPILTEDSRPFVYITIGDNANRIECPLLQLGLGASMPLDELKRSFIKLSSDYASVVIDRHYKEIEPFPDDVFKACRRIYNTRVLNDLERYFEFVS